MTRLSFAAIRDARQQISREFVNSPLVHFPALAKQLGVDIHLKLDIFNPVRSFKGRGTDTLIARLLRQPGGQRRLICASAGNLGQALAYCGQRHGFEVTIVAARTASPLKVERMRAFGANVLQMGDDFDQARKAAAEIAGESQTYLVVDSLDVATCEGAGTIALELLEQAPTTDVVLAALGNGALATGIGQVYAECGKKARVVSVQAEGAPAMTLSWQQRRFVSTESAKTIADGIAVAEPIAEVLPDVYELIDQAVLVSDGAIRQAMRLIQEHAGILCEPSGAAGVAAVLQTPSVFAGQKVVAVVCGGNITPEHFAHLVEVS